ncbi:uncharacterized protein SPAPADRAFT_66225 [Spathaspora passalidarum NRRL Y-27907]|uniref:Hap4 transcription factor heteromerisation domain-containing protein n=1 Tax=Spathaspora passalidarum (strain NRRL Y-27907 / 11-Y1) TaxID=619300 RepID=G3ALJ7_SPAPN|nr:uncharacterized protein SPAPADRAFT_66225 [Spathaspora passalidarum NRRL Y-27907]EGW33240.1 hypothetical protein SPAPADRAFT_66225 [Spathaspora passalidarum NRRL Y-27907]
MSLQEATNIKQEPPEGGPSLMPKQSHHQPLKSISPQPSPSSIKSQAMKPCESTGMASTHSTSTLNTNSTATIHHRETESKLTNFLPNTQRQHNIQPNPNQPNTNANPTRSIQNRPISQHSNVQQQRSTAPAAQQAQQGHHPHPHPIAPKYIKIQPAIAPKPISVFPKQSTFSPIPTGKTSIQFRQSLTDSLTPNTSTKNPSLNINTSKRWVLPPRPRPGRKPTANETNDDKKNTKTSPKRRTKIKKEPETKPHDGRTIAAVPPSHISHIDTNQEKSSGTPTPNTSNSSVSPSSSSPSGAGTTTPLVSTDSSTCVSPLPTLNNRTPSPKKILVTPNAPPVTVKREEDMQARTISSLTSESTPIISATTTAVPSTSSAPPLPPIKSADPNAQLYDMKMTYVAKLKEQELIRNYIEILTNQIKELSFVQNGVITFDALKTNAKPSKKNPTPTITPSTKYDQLEQINNLNDLNKFLNYLNKSSNIIQSAKKKKNQPEMSNDEVLNKQIQDYMEVRGKFKAMRSEESKSTQRVSTDSSYGNIGIDNKSKKSIIGNSTTTSIFSGAATTTLPGTDMQKSQSINTTFTPDLLRPMKASNLFGIGNNGFTSPHTLSPAADLQDDIIVDELQTETIESSPSAILSNTTESMDLFMDEHDFLNRLILKDVDEETPTVAAAAAATAAPFEPKSEEELLGKVQIHSKNSPQPIPPPASMVHHSSSAPQLQLSPQSILQQSQSQMKIMMNRDTVLKKKSKFNCGFCTNDTPCLCFDAEMEISDLRRGP